MPDLDETPDPAAPDAVLVDRAQRGDRVALEMLVRRYQKPLLYLCVRYVRDRDEAADLVQRSFVRVMNKLRELRGVEVFRTWLFRIGVNLALNHIRDHARFVDEGEGGRTAALEPAAAGADAAERIEAGELAAALRREVAALPTKQRMTLELRVYEELSFREIAEVLETTEGAAKVNFHYAVRKLRARLGDAGEAGDRSQGQGSGSGSGSGSGKGRRR